MDEELAALAALNEVAGWRGNKLAKLYGKVNSFTQILRAYNSRIDPGKVIAQYEARGIGLVAFWDESYPILLREVEGRPLLLYVRGSRGVLTRPMVAVVGSRETSQEAEEKAKGVVGEIVGRQSVVVSGLARGVDTLAHRAALFFGGVTVAVLAHGLERVYPPENRGLAEEIVKKGGALISELPWGAVIERRYFLARNRIVVGMSQGLVVVEAQLRSGSLASANHAAEMGREVLAVAGSPGCDELIEDGAVEI